MKIKIKATPDKHILESIRNSGIRLTVALAELVDNSLDAGATSVEIASDGESLVVRDNGNGCSDVAKMLQLGGHKATKTTQLGCYGVGLKDATIPIGDRLTIETFNGGTRRMADINWDELAANDWETDIDATEGDSRTGTTITVLQLRRDLKFAPVIEQFSLTFAPAIWSGAAIRVDGEDVRAWKMPLTAPEVDRTVDHPSLPASFRVRAGRCEHPHEHQPFVIAYRHRVICGADEPCGEYTPTSRFLAFVELRGRWRLHKNKDGVVKDTPQTRWLHQQLQTICSDLLERESVATDSVETAEIEAEIAESLGCVVGKPRRPGKDKPKDRMDPDSATARTVKEAGIVDPDNEGEVRQRNPGGRRGFSLCFDQIPDGMLGRVDVNGRRISVKLNSDHPFIVANRKNRAAIVLCSHFLISVQQAAAQERGEQTVLNKSIMADTFHESIRRSTSMMSKNWVETVKENRT
jgi:hypothetical protein